MAKQFNEWLDEFINNGFDSEDITHWPEEGSEPVVVEELPEDPEFGKIYAVLSSGLMYDYYTINTEGEWVDLSESGQGGVVEIHSDDELWSLDPNTIGHLVIPEDDRDEYYVVSNNGPIIRIDNIPDDFPWVDTDMSYGDIAFMGQSSSGLYEIYTDMGAYSSGLLNDFICYDVTNGLVVKSNSPENVTEMLGNISDAWNEYSSGKSIFYFTQSSGEQYWEAANCYEPCAVIPHAYSSGERWYYDGVGLTHHFSSTGKFDDPILIYPCWNGGEMDFNYIYPSHGSSQPGDPVLFYWPTWSSGEREIWNFGTDEDDVCSLLDSVREGYTDFMSGEHLSSGCIYYLGNNGFQPADPTNPFVALVTPYTNDSTTRDRDDYFSEYHLREHNIYNIVQNSSGQYALGEYYSVPEFLNANVSSGQEGTIYFPSDSNYGDYTDMPYSESGYWLERNDNNYSHSYVPRQLYRNDAPGLSDYNICDFLTTVFTGSENGEVTGFTAYIPTYSTTYYNRRYWREIFTEGIPKIIALHDGGEHDSFTNMSQNRLYYYEIADDNSYDSYASVSSVNLPTAGNPVTVTINGESYTITKN